jgi:hypothetical protein
MWTNTFRLLLLAIVPAVLLTGCIEEDFEGRYSSDLDDAGLIEALASFPKDDLGFGSSRFSESCVPVKSSISADTPAETCLRVSTPTILQRERGDLELIYVVQFSNWHGDSAALCNGFLWQANGYVFEESPSYDPCETADYLDGGGVLEKQSFFAKPAILFSANGKSTERWEMLNRAAGNDIEFLLQDGNGEVFTFVFTGENSLGAELQRTLDAFQALKLGLGSE